MECVCENGRGYRNETKRNGGENAKRTLRSYLPDVVAGPAASVELISVTVTSICEYL